MQADHSPAQGFCCRPREMVKGSEISRCLLLWNSTTAQPLHVSRMAYIWDYPKGQSPWLESKEGEDANHKRSKHFLSPENSSKVQTQTLYHIHTTPRHVPGPVAQVLKLWGEKQKSHGRFQRASKTTKGQTSSNTMVINTVHGVPVLWKSVAWWSWLNKTHD